LTEHRRDVERIRALATIDGALFTELLDIARRYRRAVFPP
jgi:hypothetical protein